MTQRYRLVGGLLAAAGCVALLPPFILLQMGPAGLEGCNDPGSASFLLSHLGHILLAHAAFGVVLSSLVVFGGAALYYGRPVGFTILKAAVWLLLLCVAAIELACLVAFPLQISSQNENRALLAGTACGVLLAGAVAVVVLLLLWRLISRHQDKQALE